MATQRLTKRLSALKKSRKARLFKQADKRAPRRLDLESLEDRRVMAAAPPVFILPNNGVLLNQGDTRNIAPRDLTFRFTQLNAIDPTTLNQGIMLERAGQDGVFGNANDVTIKPGFIGLGTNSREVVMRFADNLPDDIYRVLIVGAGANPLRDLNGNPFNAGVDYTLDFKLDLGAQVVAVVPQPVTRQPNGTLQQARNQIVVYFNDDDLDATSAQRPEFYRLYVTHNTLDPADDEEFLPTQVVYDPAADTATLTFGQVSALEQFAPNDGSADPAKSFRLRIGTDEQRRALTTTTQLETTDPGSSFATALDVGNAITTGTQGSSAAYAQSIDDLGQSPVLNWTGDGTDPGHRDIPAENHFLFAPDSTAGITTFYYNFKPVLGTIPDGIGGTQPAFNLITDAEKQRAREAFDLYSRYAGVQFIESDGSRAGEFTVATGDMRVINPLVPTGPGGVIYTVDPFFSHMAILDNAETWNDQFGIGTSPPGVSWFNTAMAAIGNLLGLGGSNDLPPHTLQGEDGRLLFAGTATPSAGGEPIFPGDADITHLQVLYRPESKDIDMYRFVLDGTGTFSAETFAERLPNSSGLDTELQLYRQNTNGTRELIARNDDYFSKDSYLQLQLGPGTYFVGISASGNDVYDPTIEDSGIGGTTQGAYEVKFDFRKSSSQSIVDAVTPANPTTVPIILDTQAVAFDGDSDGTPGGVYNFWFRSAAPSGTQAAGKARTIFVDKSFTGASTGSLTQPYSNLATALAAAQPFDIVRIVGNGGADGNIDTLADNLAYRIGFDSFGQPLADGTALNVPKDVTVMIDQGAIFQLRRSLISVGSTAPSIASDRSGGALQVLGIPGAANKPGNSVYFTSYNEVGPTSIGLDTNPLNVAPAAGDWGGLSFKSDLDRADGRFEHDKVGVFLNYVNHADIRYGGGQVNVNSVFEVVTPIAMTDNRPTVTYNLITRSADAAMSANPDSFEETNFQAPISWPRFSNTAGYAPSGVAAAPSASYTLDYKRVGPDIHGNSLVQVLPDGTSVGNSTNGLFIRTSTAAGSTLEELTVAGRFDDTDIVHVLQENLVVRGTPSGPTLETVAPPTTLIVPSVVGGGNFTAAAGPAVTTVEYKLVFADLLGNEGLASQTFGLTLPAGSGGNAVQLANLPMPTGDFVARRLYRRVLVSGQPAGEFTLVDQVPAQVTTFVDRNLPRSGTLQNLRVLDAASAVTRPRLDASLTIDPSIVIKSDGARIEVGMGAQLLAEAQAGHETIFTSLFDDRYGAGSTFDTPSDNGDAIPKVGAPGDWGGIYYSPDATGSLDHVRVAFGGGLNRIEGTFAGFNAIEIRQADVRIADSEFENNANGQGGQSPADRFGRGFNADATIFVRGAQPVIVNNLVHDNDAAFMNINVNSLNSNRVVDLGRQTGLVDRVPGHLDNNGPLIDNNRLSNNSTNGMIVRGGTLTTEGIWDDTDVVHVLLDGVNVADFHTYGGLRLESSPTESLVVKALGATAGITATGLPLEIDDRIGGTVQIVGQPGFPVVLTSLTDDTVGAGITLDGVPQVDTNGDGGNNRLTTGPEVNNGTLIDNDVATATVGHFEIRPVGGGSLPVNAAANSGATAQGQTLLFTNQDFINEFLNMIDVGPLGGAFDLSTTTITMPPTLSATTPDLVVSEGTFAGPNGLVKWHVESSIANGTDRVTNTLTFSSPQPLGAIRYVNYLDPNILLANDDLLYQVGSPGQPNFRLYTLDNAQRIGFAQGGVYKPGTGLINATYNGFAADKNNDLRTALTGAGTAFTPTGNIDTVDLRPFTDPALGNVNGLADVTTAMSWTVDPLATTATITTFLDLVPQAPLSAGRPGDWQGVTIDQWANDRNVATVLEREPVTSDGSSNAIPEKAQVIGQLATIEKGGDETLRLGFTIQGVINNSGDQDVYSFTGKAGTEVWIDLDRTTMALDTVVELIDNLGNVLARSNDSPSEAAGATTLDGIGRLMQKTPPYEGTDFYTTNPRDGGMRLVLPGPANTTNTYFIRVRSKSGAEVSEVAQGAAGSVAEVAKGGTNSAVQVMPANSPSSTTVLQGNSASVAETVKGGTGQVVELLQGGTGSTQTLVTGAPATVTETAKGGSAFSAELQRGGSGQVSTVIDGATGSVTEVVKGGNAVAAEIMRGGSPAVVTLVQGGGGANEQQSFGFASPPSGGTFTLTFNGQTTTPLAFNATAGVVQAALENLNNIAPGDVLVTFVAGAWNVTFQGAYANQNVAELIGSSNEIQRITLPAAAPFTLDFGGQVTAVLPATATAAQIQAALEGLSTIGVANVLVSGAAGGPWDVQFTGALANTNVGTIAISDREIQRVAVASTQAGGAFTLTFNGQTTAALDPFTATAAQVQTALENLSNINVGDVAVTGNAGGPWDVAFKGALGSQDVAPLTIGVNERQSLTILSTGGNFVVEFNGQRTAPIPFNALPAAVDTALEAISTIGLNGVNVTGVPGNYVVEFTGPLANTNVVPMTLEANEFQRITNPVAGGALTLSFGGQVTASIPGNATAAQVQAALEGLSTIGVGNVAVTAGAPGGPYDVEFKGPLAKQNVAQIGVLASELMPGGGLPIGTLLQGGTGTGTEVVKGGNVAAAELMRGNSLSFATPVPGSAANNEQQTFTFTAAPSAGTFKLTFNGQTTAAIPFFASAAAVQSALEALSTINPGNVSVGFSAGTWTVTFQNALGNADVPPLTGTVNEIQRVANPVAGSQFTLNYNGQITPLLAANSTAAQVQTALEALSTINAGNVLVSGAAGGPYDVQFTNALANTNVNALGINSREVQRLTLSGGPTGGSFFVTFGAQQSGPIAFNATAATVQAILGAIPGIGAPNVAVSGPAGGPWDVTFQNALAQTDVAALVPVVNETQTINAQTAAGGTFTLTFNGQTTGNLNFNATAAQVQGALQNLSSIGPNNAIVTLNGGVYTVVFQGGFANQNVTQMISSSNELQRITPAQAGTGFALSFGGQVTGPIAAGAPAIAVQTALEGLNNIAPGDIIVSAVAGGRYDVQFTGTGAFANQNVPQIGVSDSEIQTIALAAAPAGSTFTVAFNGQTTAAIPINATAATLQAALEALSTIGVGNVSVAGNAGGPWAVTFQGALATQDLPLMTAGINAQQSFTITGTPTGGFFELTFQGQTTAPIPVTATAAAVQAALESLSNIAPGDVAVTYAAGTGTVTFGGAYAGVNVPLMSITVDEFQQITNAVPGAALTLSVNGQATPAIPADANGAAVQAALEALLGVGNVLVTGPAGGPWTVEFTGALGNSSHPLIAVLDNEIMRGSGPPISTAINGASGVVTEVIKGSNAVATELMQGASVAVSTTVQGGAAVNEKQTVSFTSPPTSGTFSLTFNGETTGPLAFNASAATVQTALQGLGTIGAGNAVVSFAAGTWTVTFQGALANTNVSSLIGAANELQQVASPGINFTLTFGGQTTGTILPNATAATVQLALESLSNIAPGNVIVTGPAGGPWGVQFTGALANQNFAPLATSAREVQHVALSGTPTGGTFTLNFNGQTTAALPYNASAAAVQAALEALATVGLNNVAVTLGAGNSWDVVFQNSLGSQDVPALVAHVNEVQQIDLRTTAGGTYSLVFNGQQTSVLPFDATAAMVQAALESLSNIGPGDVLVTSNGGILSVTFQGALADQNVVQLAGVANEIQRVTAPSGGGAFTLTFDGQITAPIAGNATAAAVQAALEALNNISPGDVIVTAAGAGTWDIEFAGVYVNQDVPQMVVNDNEIQRVSLTGSPTAGTFTLSFNNQTTGAIPVTATAAQVQAALQALSTIGVGNVVVAGPAGGPWDVSFGGLLASQDVPALVAGVNEVQSFTLQGNPTAGTFTLTFSGQTTAPIAFNASAAAVQLALENLSNINPGDVAVAFAGGVWTVTFQGALANTNVPQLTGNSNEFQIVANPVPGAGLTLQFNGQTTALIPGNATALQVQTALENLSNINPGDVVVTGNAGGPYTVQFTGALANQSVSEIGILDAQIMQANAPAIATQTQGSSLQNEVQTVSLLGNPVGGTFTLTFNGQRTAPIPFSASAAQVQAALTALSTIGANNVSVGKVAGVWTVTFQGTLAKTNVAQMTGNSNEFQRITTPVSSAAFSLSFNGQKTATIPGNATPAQVQAALEALSNINPGDVVVTGNNGGPFDVEFTGAFANQDVSAMVIGQDEIQRITLQPAPTGGTFTLTFQNQTTAPIAVNATAASVQTALEALPALGAGNVLVTGNAGGPWDVRFTGTLGQIDVPALTIGLNEIQRVTILGTPTGGSFTLSFGGEKTTPLPYNATAADVQAALEALNIIAPGDVVVSGNAGGPYDIRFQQAFANTNVPAIVVDSDGVLGGLTSGAYQLQIRLREVDEIGGSTVQFANIRNAVNGIKVLGQPTHSPLSGEYTEAAANDTRATAQPLGNLLNSDRGAKSLAASISAPNDQDWYQLTVNYDALQAGGLTNPEDWWSTIFDIDYADGLARPNLVVSVYNTSGNLILTSRDSNVADDRPTPLNPTDLSDQGRGSSGLADPWIGPAELPQGTYFVAITSDALRPQEFDQFTQPAATNPLVRLEPINGVQRIVEDHIEFEGGSTGSDPTTLNFMDNNSIIPWNLNDVTMFVTRDTAPTPNQTQVLTVDPFLGYVETTVGTFASNIGDLAINPSTGGLFAYTTAEDTGNTNRYRDAQAGNYLQISPGNAASTLVGDDGIETYMLDPTAMMPMEVLANDIGNMTRVGEGVHFRAMDISQYNGVSFPNNPFAGGLAGFAVGGRDPSVALFGNGNDDPNILYAFNPVTGAASSILANNRTALARATQGAATQIVERGILDTLIDSNPQTNPNAVQTTEATFVDPVTGATTFRIKDSGYPVGPGRPSEIPSAAIAPDPTTFRLTTGGPGTLFEFDAGPEALLNINPTVLNQQIRDNQAVTVSGTRIEFDTGPVINTVIGTAANYPTGSFIDVTDVDPDPLGPGTRPPQTIRFEFTATGTVTAGNIPVFIGDAPSAITLADRIVAAINAQQATKSFTTQAVRLSGTPRVSLTNRNLPTINQNDDSNAVQGGGVVAGVVTGAIGVTAGAVQVRIEETSVQADLTGAFARVNQATMPLNSVVGVSGAAGVGRVTIGWEGDRLNFSGGNTITVNGVAASVLQTVGSQGGVGAGRTAVPFLAQDTAATLATRMANVAAAAGFASAFSTATALLVPGATVVSADPPLITAAQAPGGNITGLAVINDNLNPPNQHLYAVTDTGGLFEVIQPYSTNARLDYIDGSQGRLAAGGANIDFSGLDAGPNNVEGGRYAQMFFATSDDGMLYAFDNQGNPQQIFASTFNPVTNQEEAQTRIQLRQANGTPLTQVNGVRFSTLDRNLWHETPTGGTPERQGDAGHGVLAPFDRSRNASGGQSSLHFGRGSTSDVDLPGGAHGTVESNTFDLTGYSASDNPVLYFNYYMETEGINHTAAIPMRDAFRVFISGDDGVWHMLTTNDGGVVAGAINDDFDYTNPKPLEIFDQTPQWRQARVPLGDFAGQDHLKLRFDFSTAGSMNVGGARLTPTVGDELRAVDGQYLRDQQTFTLTAPGQGADLDFELDLGYTLVAPNGAAIPDGAQFTIDGVGFEFDLNGNGATPGFIAVPYALADSPASVAQRIAFAIGGVSPVQVNGNRLNLRGGAAGAVTGATNVTALNMPAGFIEGAPGAVNGIEIDVHAGMTRDQVREAIALVLANTYAQGNRAQIKTQNEIVRLIGFSWVRQSAGPFNDTTNQNQRLLGITTSLPGDDWGAFNSNLRGQNNAGIEGIYVDDIIIGFAERGEMITGSNGNNAHVANPGATISNPTAGTYQLEIRRGPETGVPDRPTAPAMLALLPSIDTNDRLTPSLAMVAKPGNQIADGDFFTLSDGLNEATFEFNDTTLFPNTGVQPGRTQIDYNPRMRDYEIAQLIRAAINSASVQATLDIQAQLSDGVLGGGSTSKLVNLLGPISVIDFGGFGFVNYQTDPNAHYGDRNLFRDQGQILLEGNNVANSSQWGILIDNNPRTPADGNTPHQGPVANLAVPNTQRLVPGVVVTNNVVANNGLGAIKISGDTTTDAAVGFSRVTNNTLYGLGGSLTGGAQTDIGIRVEQNSAPTLMNNIIANFNLGISVDNTSLPPLTVLGGNLFQGNDTNSNVGVGGSAGDFPIVLANTDPLFVNAAIGNFYLKAQSQAIDSSVDSLLDRPGLVSVKSPLGILPSPILSPDRDGVGQLRVDDPSVATPQGFGLNPFKDRGAIDRVDFSGPTSQLINPQDNDALGVDLDPSPSIVVLQNQIVTDFTIALTDRTDPNGPVEGSDIDDTSVTGNSVIVEVLGAGGPTRLVEGIDYAFSYDSTNNLIRLTPLGGLWPLSQTYHIILNNNPVGGITDNAGNVLQPNQTDGTHTYTIFLGSAVDWGDAPDSYGTTAAANGPNHQIIGNMFLGAGNSADPDGQPSAAADLDTFDDGITFGNLQPGGGVDSSQISVVASLPGKLDGWIDLNNDGDFLDAGEHVLQSVALVGGIAPQDVRFQIPAGLTGTTYARFRYTSAGINTPLGPAPDGEVEDYRVTLVGPQYQNPKNALDVSNDGIISPLDALLVINYVNYLSGQLITPGGNLPLPIVSPPYLATTPPIDQTGAGVPGQGRYLDVNGDGFLSSLDALIIINFLNNPPGSPEGEGEGEAAPMRNFAAATLPAEASAPRDAQTPTIPALLMAGPGIEYALRSTQTVGALAENAIQDQQSDDLGLNLLAQDQAARNANRQSLRLADVLSLEGSRPYGPLTDATWEELLSGLASDSGRDRNPSQSA